MTIDEAIKVLTPDIDEVLICPIAELKQAKRLGIEALKRVKSGRKELIGYLCYPLVGETP